MAQKTPIVPVLAGIDPASFTPTATTGDTISNPRGDLMLRINNGSGGSITATLTAFQVSRPADGTFPSQTVADAVVTIGAGATKLIGPVPPAYIDSGGNTKLLCSAVTTVSVEAFRGNPAN